MDNNKEMAAFDAEQQRLSQQQQQQQPPSGHHRRQASTAFADAPVTWMSLPRKDQLLILLLCRFVDFLQVASLQAYVFYQLKSIGPDETDAQIATQAGLLQACFTGAQVLTAMLWGKAADAAWCGRKRVLFIGLAGTAVSCVGYGFATSLFWAAFWRIVGGGINGTVGIIRTMISEIIKEKKYQSRAFLILPMSFNLANIIGPVMGGFLADPALNLPGVFGEGGWLACQWIQDYPYALPSVLNAVLLAFSSVVAFFFLEETSKERRGKFDVGLYITARIRQFVCRNPSNKGYAPVLASDNAAILLEHMQELKPPASPSPSVSPSSSPSRSVRRERRLPFRRVWTRNVVLTLLVIAFYDFHLGAFANVWAMFLSTPRLTDTAATTATSKRAITALAGGLGMPASDVGVASSFLGLLGMLLQLTLYPPVSARLGTLRSFRWFLVGFPLAYALAPILVLLPSSAPAPAPASGALLWAGLVVVLLLQVAARTFTLPASIILLNNCSPHPSVLGTVHGLGQSVSAGFRTVGPVVGGWWYGLGLTHGQVQNGWLGIAAAASVGCVVALFIYEGSGHEIILEGDDDAEEDMPRLR